jgi:hypothetical protein
MAELSQIASVPRQVAHFLSSCSGLLPITQEDNFPYETAFWEPSSKTSYFGCPEWDASNPTCYHEAENLVDWQTNSQLDNLLWNQHPPSTEPLDPKSSTLYPTTAELFLVWCTSYFSKGDPQQIGSYSPHRHPDGSELLVFISDSIADAPCPMYISERKVKVAEIIDEAMLDRLKAKPVMTIRES